MFRYLAVILAFIASPVLAQSATVSSLPAAASVTGAEKIPVMQGTNPVRITPSQIASYIGTPGAWTQYTPTLSCGSGTLTTATALGRYKQVGKTMTVQLTLKVPANGSCAAFLIATLPAASFDDGQGSSWVLAGREDGTSGKALTGLISANANTVIVRDATNGYPAASGSTINLSGVYERN